LPRRRSRAACGRYRQHLAVAHTAAPDRDHTSVRHQRLLGLVDHARSGRPSTGPAPTARHFPDRPPAAVGQGRRWAGDGGTDRSQPSGQRHAEAFLELIERLAGLPREPQVREALDQLLQHRAICRIEFVLGDPPQRRGRRLGRDGAAAPALDDDREYTAHGFDNVVHPLPVLCERVPNVVSVSKSTAHPTRRVAMQRIALVAMVLAALLVVPTAAFATGGGSGGVTGPAFYVDGALYRTVGTPTDLSNTGGPDSSFDVIYGIDGQPNVATAAPGDDGYNGGRWRVHALSFTDYDAAVDAVDANGSGDLDSAAEVHAAMGGGFVIDDTIVRSFECPVIPVPRNG
jgi:hypothetical protein